MSEDIIDRLDDVAASIRDSVGESNANDRRMSRLYQITLALQFRDLILAAKSLAREKQVSGMWVTIRALAELYIRASWIGEDHAKTIWMVFGEKAFEKRQLELNIKAIQELGDTPSPGKITALQIMTKELADAANRLTTKDPLYWDAKKLKFKEPPKLKDLAPPVKEDDKSVSSQEKGRYHIYSSFYKYGCWFTHSSNRILENHFEKTTTSTIPLINLFASTDEDFQEALYAVFLVGLKFAQDMQDTGFPVDTDRLDSVSTAAYSLKP